MRERHAHELHRVHLQHVRHLFNVGFAAHICNFVGNTQVSFCACTAVLRLKVCLTGADPLDQALVRHSINLRSRGQLCSPEWALICVYCHLRCDLGLNLAARPHTLLRPGRLERGTEQAQCRPCRAERPWCCNMQQ